MCITCRPTASPHHRNALGKLGRGGVHSSGSSGNTIVSTHRATGTWNQEEIRRERGRDYQKGERAAEEEADNKRRGHTVFFLPLLWSGMGSKALHGLARAVRLSYTLRPIVQL